MFLFFVVIRECWDFSAEIKASWRHCPLHHHCKTNQQHLLHQYVWTWAPTSGVIHRTADDSIVSLSMHTDCIIIIIIIAIATIIIIILTNTLAVRATQWEKVLSPYSTEGQWFDLLLLPNIFGGPIWFWLRNAEMKTQSVFPFFPFSNTTETTHPAFHRCVECKKRNTGRGTLHVVLMRCRVWNLWFSLWTWTGVGECLFYYPQFSVVNAFQTVSALSPDEMFYFGCQQC